MCRYDTGAHVAEETHSSHISTPRAMAATVALALVLGELVILGFNSAIADLPALLAQADAAHVEPYTLLWQQVRGIQIVNFEF
jgi:hypothetical protein